MTSRRALPFWIVLLLLFAVLPARAASKLNLPPAAVEGLEKLYDGDPAAAIENFRALQQQAPDSPLGYLLETEARWWEIYCSSAEFKWGMTDAWCRDKRPKDAAYFAAADKAISLAEARLKQSETAEMRLYAGMAYALKARLLGLRDERRATARAGVRAREHLLRAVALDPDLADAYLGLGLYNYYVDTLSAIARVLRFFMGIPGGDRREGVRQLERAIAGGAISGAEARFTLAKNLRNYDRDYERAARVLEPLVAQHSRNPLFQLLLGDLNAKLGRREKAAAHYRAAAAIPLRDPECSRRIQHLARQSLAAIAAPSP